MDNPQPSDADLYYAFANPRASRAKIAAMSQKSATRMVAYQRNNNVTAEMRDLPLSNAMIAEAVVRFAQSESPIEESQSPIALRHREEPPGKQLETVQLAAVFVGVGSAVFACLCWFFASLPPGITDLAQPFVYGGIALAVVGATIAYFATVWRFVKGRRRLTVGRVAESFIVVGVPILLLLWLAVTLTGTPNNVTEFRLQRLFGRRDLASANLSGADLSYLNLSGVDLSGADLIRTSLRGADLTGANLSRANLSDAGLRSANLSLADLSGADLTGASLSDAGLSDANLSGANLSHLRLSGLELSRANLSRANMGDANLSGADLSKADLSGTNLSGTNLSRANLSDANLSGADLSKADLSGTNLSGTNLSGTNLNEAYLNNTNLSGAEVDDNTEIADKWRLVLEIATEGGRERNLAGADLSWANLQETDLSLANLSGADLSGTNLRGADLSFANLSRSNLGWANLSLADLSLAKLSGAEVDDNTRIADKWRLVLEIATEGGRERNLAGADLSWANLNEADLSLANLSGADLSDTDLHGADLSLANLSGANLSSTDLRNANLTGAIMPDGTVHE